MKIAIGSNQIAQSYIIEHKFIGILWRAFMRKGGIYMVETIISNKLFWVEWVDGKFLRFRWKNPLH